MSRLVYTHQLIQKIPVGGGPDFFSHLHISEGRMDLPQRNNWTQGVQLLLEGDPYQYF